jgi:uncharacterized protein YjbJ (UPF0337 family)
MNWERIQVNWRQLKGNVKLRWSQLTDDQLDAIAGDRGRLAGKIQEIYGVSVDEAEKQLSRWQTEQKELNFAK